MATQTIISGYIESVNKHTAYNQDCINNFAKKSKPFGKVISYPMQGFGATIFPIGCITNLKETEWNSWMNDFEELVHSLKAFSVKILFESSNSERRVSFEYINMSVSQADVGNKWKKYVSILKENIIEESELAPF